MTGFMMQKGYIAIAGNAGDALADSMYEGTIYVAGEIASLGNDAVVEDAASEEDQAMLEAAFAEFDLPRPGRFQRIVAGRKLWNFETARARHLAGRAVTPGCAGARPAGHRGPAPSTPRRSSARSRRRPRSGATSSAASGPSARKPLPSLDDLTFLPASLTRIPLEGYREKCVTTTVLGTRFAEQPISLDIPIMITGMSYGALSLNAKIALARGASRGRRLDHLG